MVIAVQFQFARFAEPQLAVFGVSIRFCRPHKLEPWEFADAMHSGRKGTRLRLSGRITSSE
jgi:hypothetical protein